MTQENKPIPLFKTDQQIAAFVETADLSAYDLSGFRPVHFRIGTDFLGTCMKKRSKNFWGVAEGKARLPHTPASPTRSAAAASF